jgi:small subunit ribosomal protein S20
MRTAMKNVLKAVKSGDKDAATTSFRAAVPVIDRMASKGIIKKNRAAGYKRRLNARVKSMA